MNYSKQEYLHGIKKKAATTKHEMGNERTEKKQRTSVASSRRCLIVSFMGAKGVLGNYI